MMVDETIDDSTSTVMFKPICAHCGYVFKKIEYNANKPYYGWKLSESGFTPPYCPGCGRKIVSLTIPMELVYESDFFRKMLGMPTKAEEKEAEKKAKADQKKTAETESES